MARQVRLGLAGLGRGARLTLKAVQHHGADLTAVADPEETRRDAFKKLWAEEIGKQAPPVFYEDLDAMLEHDALDAVVVATPAPMHARQAIQCMEAGFHVLSEVPAAFDLDEAKDLVACVRKTGLLYFFAENCCYWYFVKEWKKLVGQGRIGDPQYCEGEYIHGLGAAATRFGKPNWRYHLDPIRYCTHETGPLLEILDDRVVQAVGMGTSSKVHPGKRVDDIQVALFKTAGGVSCKQLNGFAVVRPGYFAEGGDYHYYSMYGSGGFLETTRSGRFETLAAFRDMNHGRDVLHFDMPIPDPHLPASAKGGHGTADWEIMRDFVGCIRDGGEPAIDVYRGLDFSLPGIVARESLRNGSMPMEVPDPRSW